MKTARRTELQTNQLANWMGLQIARIQQHRALFIFALMAGIALVAAWLFMTNQWAERDRRLWDAYIGATQTGNAVELQNLADQFPTSDAGQWARLTLANSQLSIGINALFTDRTAANASLKMAEDNFRDLSRVTRTSMFEQESLLGLARALESQDKLAAAREQYKIVADRWPNTVFGQQASERLERLASRSTETFYKDFTKSKTSSPMANEPGTPGARPSTNVDDVKEPETPKSNEPAKAAQPETTKSSEPTKTPEAAKTSEPAKTPEPAKTVEPEKTTEPAKTPETPK